MDSLLVRKSNEIAIRKSMLDCDYYRWIEGDGDEEDRGHVEYMSQYSWAEYTQGRLWFDQ